MAAERTDRKAASETGTTVGVELAIEELHAHLLRCWNERDAHGYADLFAPDGTLVGFDGSCVDTAASIAEHLLAIFEDHQPAAYVAKVREVRSLGGEVVLLRAVAGMVPPGGSDIRPAMNAVQSLVAIAVDGGWKVAHFQNTPARFDGRPDEVAAVTAELRAELEEGRPAPKV